jgi:hypothetical protein
VTRLGDVKKRLAAIVVALALLVIGCGAVDEPVHLLTGDYQGMASSDSCFAATGSGLLIVDPTYGTAIIANHLDDMVELTDLPVTVAWRPGFTARRSGSEVEVLDPHGNAVAMTGRNYRLWGGYADAGGSSGLKAPELRTTVFWACGDVQPLP